MILEQENIEGDFTQKSYGHVWIYTDLSFSFSNKYTII